MAENEMPETTEDQTISLDPQGVQDGSAGTSAGTTPKNAWHESWFWRAIILALLALALLALLRGCDGIQLPGQTGTTLYAAANGGYGSNLYTTNRASYFSVPHRTPLQWDGRTDGRMYVVIYQGKEYLVDPGVVSYTDPGPYNPPQPQARIPCVIGTQTSASWTECVGSGSIVVPNGWTLIGDDWGVPGTCSVIRYAGATFSGPYTLYPASEPSPDDGKLCP